MAKRCGKIVDSGSVYPHPCVREKGHTGACNPTPRRPRDNGDALSLRPAEPGSLEWDYMHRYDSPDNRRDTMG